MLFLCDVPSVTNQQFAWNPTHRRRTLDYLIIGVKTSFYSLVCHLYAKVYLLFKSHSYQFDRKIFFNRLLKTSAKEGQHETKNMCVFSLPRKDDIYCALRRPLVLTEVVVRRWPVCTKWLLAPGSWRRPNLKWFKTDRPPNERRTDRRLLISIIRLLTAGRLPTPSPCLSSASFTFSEHRHRQFLNGVITRP